MRNSLPAHLLSFILPATVLIIVPACILWVKKDHLFGWGMNPAWDIFSITTGVLLAACGLFLLCWTISLFHNRGKGTLAPWSPTQKLVITGPYRHTRNPMISGVLTILLGETLVFGSTGLLIWFVIFFLINHIYFILLEEPGLVKRFGGSYLEYKRNVPRWIPRPKPTNQV
jgi:protein-S-isoprenylcysteine O-methyltransferase Ste14